MGSTGTGHLSDYSDYKGKVAGVTGGKDTIYFCDRAIETHLEDVETSDYYKNHKNLPQKDMGIVISTTTRIVAVSDQNEIIGNLPTEYNYLLACIEEGYQYEGIVVDSYLKPLPSVTIAVTPQKIESK